MTTTDNDTSGTMLTIKNLRKFRRDGDINRCILNNLNLTLEPGESVAVIGPSGCGKSTLLHLIAGLDTADGGDIQLENESILSMSEAQLDNYRKSRIGIVFQQFNLIDCLSVQDNILLPARLKNNLDLDYFKTITALLGVTPLLHKKPFQTSGGEQQRIAVARALIHKPQLVLADEPTGNLDEKNSLMVGKLLFDACQKLNTSLIMVTHSQQFAAMAQRSLRLQEGQLVSAQQPVARSQS
ncbi:ABC transporter ATP-binding protein [Planctobacterium marinum]|uniref:Macrolide ABC transporter ATP-binding protein n=1 Tax=Planctobacterium marinum TaxID=1631968 RepID=A0AA48HQT5_9ALTE|nr:macrolide ABC transporter ATP-binding protein [Planctobacterium marinum]